MHFTLAPLSSFDIGAVVSVAIALAALRIGTLSRGGALAAVAVGTATFAALGVPGACVLLAFFATSVGLSRYGRAKKRERLTDVGKTGARDAAQVLANGGIAAACALAAAHGDARFVAAFAGAFAAAAADTWGTEIGTLARERPRSILTLRYVATGLSGGVTRIGTLAECAGALADSILGASVQTLRYCPQCVRPTEREPHGCGANTYRIRGSDFIGNDAVNFVATATGAAVAYALAPYFFSK